MGNRWGNSGNWLTLFWGALQWKQWLSLFWGALKSLQMVTTAMKLKDSYSWNESYDKPRQYINKQKHYFADKDP